MLDTFTDPYKPETVGVSAGQAFELARAAKSCITLADADTEPFLTNLPEGTENYHSFDDLTEIIWRSFLSREDVKRESKVYPQGARSSSTYIWRQAILHADRELHNIINPPFMYTTYDKKVEVSSFHRTVISDPAMVEFYEGIKQGRLTSGIGKQSLTYVEMLLAGTHPNLIDPDWPEDVLAFMGGSYDPL